MSKLIKICLSLISILLLGSIITGKSYAALSCKVSMQAPQSTYTKEDEFSVTVSISNLQAGKGIVTLGAVLDYDKTALDLKEVEGENKWSAQIGENKAKIIAYSGKKVTEDETVMKLTFAVKKDTTAKSTWVKINNFEVSDGNEEVTAKPATLTLSIKDKEVTPPNEESSNENQGEPTTNNQATTNNNKKPNTTGQNSTTTNKKTENTEKPVEEEPDTSEEENTEMNLISDEEMTNTIQETEGKMENLTQSTEEEQTVKQKKGGRGILIVALVVVVLIVIAIIIKSFMKPASKH